MYGEHEDVPDDSCERMLNLYKKRRRGGMSRKQGESFIDGERGWERKTGGTEELF